MSIRIIADSSSNRNSASARASSVLPTPVGPRNRKLPIGRFRSFTPAAPRGDRDLGESPRSLGLADAGRSEKQEAADRPVRILQAGARAAHRGRDGLKD